MCRLPARPGRKGTKIEEGYDPSVLPVAHRSRTRVPCQSSFVRSSVRRGRSSAPHPPHPLDLRGLADGRRTGASPPPWGIQEVRRLRKGKVDSRPSKRGFSGLQTHSTCGRSCRLPTVPAERPDSVGTGPRARAGERSRGGRTGTEKVPSTETRGLGGRNHPFFSRSSLGVRPSSEGVHINRPRPDGGRTEVRSRRTTST